MEEAAVLSIDPSKRPRNSGHPLDNAALAELLARAAEGATGHLHRALRKAARTAFLWPIEAAELWQAGRSLTELPSIGPYLEKQIQQWLETPPARPDEPSVRRHFLTLAQANQILEANPDWTGAYRGDLQMHSTWSDGSASIREMAEAAEQRGYAYIAITDHSKGLKIAGGINEFALSQQAEEIEGLNEELALNNSHLRVLRSIELNLNPQGEGDMDSASLAALDLVVGSFHSALRKKEDQTERYLAALRNRDVHILGHPRGRVYNHRTGLSADWPRVFSEAARLDKAVEVDCYPDRQDLDIELLALARRRGARIAIDTDAHGPAQLEFAKLGLAAALRAGYPAERIVNFMSADQLLSWVNQLR